MHPATYYTSLLWRKCGCIIMPLVTDNRLMHNKILLCMRVLVLLLLLHKPKSWFLQPTTIMRSKLMCDSLPNKTTYTIHTTQDPYECVMYATHTHTHTHTHLLLWSFFSSFWRSSISLLLSKDLVAETYDEYWFFPRAKCPPLVFLHGPISQFFFCFVLFFSKHPKPH
jgi:hypothetical protein